MEPEKEEEPVGLTPPSPPPWDPDPPNPDLDFSDDEMVTVKNLLDEKSGGLEKPFRDFGGVGVLRDNVPIIPIVNESAKFDVGENGAEGPAAKPIISAQDAFINTFDLIGNLTENDFWALNEREQKTVKKLCVFPSLDKYLAKFGVYGCVLVLIQIIFKRLKLQYAAKEEIEEEPDATPTEISDVNRKVTEL